MKLTLVLGLLAAGICGAVYGGMYGDQEKYMGFYSNPYLNPESPKDEIIDLSSQSKAGKLVENSSIVNIEPVFQRACVAKIAKLVNRLEEANFQNLTNLYMLPEIVTTGNIDAFFTAVIEQCNWILSPTRYHYSDTPAIVDCLNYLDSVYKTLSMLIDDLEKSNLDTNQTNFCYPGISSTTEFIRFFENWLHYPMIF